MRSTSSLSIPVTLLILIGLAKVPGLWPTRLQKSKGPPISAHESLLAKGRKVPLSEADLFTLSMVIGLSDKRALSLLQAKERILIAARTLPEDQKWRAFTLMPGIGPKKGKELFRYLSLE